MKTPSNWEEETPVLLLTSCKQAARLISLSFERRLTLKEFICMRLHLWMCKTCSFYRHQIRALRAIFCCHERVLDNTPAEPHECLDARAKERLKNTIEQARDS